MLNIHSLNYYLKFYLNTSDFYSLYIASKFYHNYYKSFINKLFNDLHIHFIYYKNEPFYCKYIIYGSGIFWYKRFIKKYKLSFDYHNNYYYKYLNINDKIIKKLKLLPPSNISYSFSNYIFT